MSKYYEEYIDFVWHTQNIDGYGDWHCNERTHKDFNEWLDAAELEHVTIEDMTGMERKLIDSGIDMENLYE